MTSAALSAWLAGNSGGRSGRTGDRLHGLGRHVVRWDAGTIHDSLTEIRFEFAKRPSALTGKEPKELRRPERESCHSIRPFKAPEIWRLSRLLPKVDLCPRRRPRLELIERSPIPRKWTIMRLNILLRTRLEPSCQFRDILIGDREDFDR